MKDRILALRAAGYSYNKIAEELGCSKGTISYHCGDGQKEKSRKRLRDSRRNQRVVVFRKLDGFMRNHVHQFKRGRNIEKTTGRASYLSFYEKILENPKCYLTGRNIDLADTRSYNLDHIVPRAKGGKNDLTNCGLTCRDANWAKSDMSLDDFIELCKEVCINFGYQIK